MDNSQSKKDEIINAFFYRDRHFGILLLAIFIFNACWILDSLAVFVLARPVSLIIHAVFLMITIIAGIAVFLFYLVKSGHEKAKSIINALFSIVMMVLFVSISSLLLNLWADMFIPQMIKPGSLNEILGAGIFLLIAFLLNCIFLFTAQTSCVYLMHGVKFSQLGRATLLSLQNIYKNLGTFFFNAAALFGFLIFYYILNDAIASLLSSILPAIFLSKFILYVVITVLRTLIVAAVIRMCIRMNSAIEEELFAIETPEKKRIPILAVSVFILAIATSVMALPGSIKGADTLLTDIECRMIMADSMVLEGENRQAVTELTRAEADLDSLQKYIKKILKSKGENIDIPPYGISSKHIYSACAYDDYFNVLLTMDSNKDQYNRGKLSNYIKTIPESAIWAYGYYKEKGMREEALKMFNAVVMQGVFADRFMPAQNYTISRLNNLLERTEQLQVELNNRKLYVFEEKAKYADRKALIKEIENDILTKGGNSELYAYVATLTEETAQGDSDYERMKDNALKYYESIKFENHKKLVSSVEFVTYMLYRSFHNDDAVAFASERYREYPGDVDIALIYANALMEKRNHQESNAILMAIGEENAYKDYLLAINYLEQGEYEKSLQCADNLEKALTLYKDDEEVLAQLDFYLYGYILECINYFERDNDSSDSNDFGEKKLSLLIKWRK